MIKHGLILSFICLFIGCSEKIEYTEKLNLQFTANAIEIINSTDDAIHFKLKINNLFPLDYKDISKSIEQIEKKSLKNKDVASWIFVKENTFHSYPFSKESWQHNPVLFLNSIGGGYCDDRASVLAKIWQMQGDSSRIIGLDGHVVPEILRNNAWQMYDPDNGVYYCHKSGAIKSVGDLEHSLDSVHLAQCDDQLINPIFKFDNPITRYLTSVYRSYKNNHDVTEWHMSYSENSNEFSLPAHSSLEIIHDEKTNVTSFTVKLNTKSKGELKMPLVPYQASGKMELLSIDTSFAISGAKVLFPRNQFYSKMEVSRVEKKSEIRFLINPKLSFFKTQNNIEIHSSEPLEVKALCKNSSSASVLFAKEQLFLDQKTILHQGFLSTISEYHQEKLDESFIKEKYALFLEGDKTLSDQNRIELKAQFNDDYKKVFGGITKAQNKFIEERYPTSIFYLFLASRYQKVDSIFQFLNQQ